MRFPFPIFAFVAILGTLIVMPAATNVVTNREPITLPAYEVTESRLLPPQENGWAYARIPGFEVLSSLSNRDTRTFLRDTLLFMEAVEVIWPAIKNTPAPDTVVILCGQKDKKFESFLPKGVPFITISGANIATYLFHDDEINACILTDRVIPSHSDKPDKVTNAVGLSSHAWRSQLQTRLQFLPIRIPPWLQESLVTIAANLSIYEKENVTLGSVYDTTNPDPEVEVKIFGGRALDQSLAELFNYKASDLDVNDTQKFDPTQRRTEYNRKQALAFTHMCLFGRGLRYQKPLNTFLILLAQEPDGDKESLFRQAFKMSYREMEDELSGYGQFTDYTLKEYRAKRGQGLSEPIVPEVREAADGEIARLAGEVYLLAGYPDRAREQMINAYRRGSRDPNLLSDLGTLELGPGGDPAKARKFLAVAVQSKTQRASAYYNFAKIRLAELNSVSDRPNSSVQSEELRQVFVFLGEAHARWHPVPPAKVFRLIAEAHRIRTGPIPKTDLQVLLQGIKLYPRDKDLARMAKQLFTDNGFNKEALAITDFIRANQGKTN